MKISVVNKVSGADVLYAFLFQFEGKKKPSLNFSKELSKESLAMIEGVIADGDFKGEEGEMVALYLPSDAKRVVLTGLGVAKEFTLETLREVSAGCVSHSKKYKAKSISVLLPSPSSLPHRKTNGDLVEAFTLGYSLGSYTFDRYMTKKQDYMMDDVEMSFVIGSGSTKDVVSRATEGYDEALGVRLTRDLVNTPSSHMVPSQIAKEAEEIGKSSSKITVKVFNEAEIKKMGMGLLYTVGEESVHPSRFVILEYKNKPKNKKPIALVGKGITFDTGGVNLKPTNHIEDMKMDMGGSATVLGVFKVLSKMDLPIHVVGVLACAENAIGGGAFRPGDILTAYNKKTVEITNTDAEGRLVLGDALAYIVKNIKPEAIITMATLTGACIVALGNDITAVVSDNDKLKQRLKKASEASEEPTWELPFYMPYIKRVKSDIADIKNWTAGVSAGTVMAGGFLRQFTEDTPWAHLDIAGTAWSKENKGYKTKGGTGAMVRTLWNLLKNY